LTEVHGWVAPKWEGVRAAFERNFEKDGEVGAAFGAYHRGEKVVDLWGGVADSTTGRPWEEDTLVLVFSTTKGIVAMCANRLADSGALDVETPVGKYWPEFAQAGKEDVTVADLLAHRAGLAWTDGEMSVDEMLSWDPVVEALEAQAPSWKPGTAHGYHATTYSWLVGEVVRRVSGRRVGTYLREEIAGPLGAEFFIGLPGSEEHRIASLIPFSVAGFTAAQPATSASSAGELGSNLAGLRADSQHQGAVPDAALSELVSKYLGPDGSLLKALRSPGGAFRDESLWDSPRLHASEIPAANGICDARSLALLYSACVSDVTTPSGEKLRVFSPRQLERALRQETHGPDLVLLGLDIQWGLGFMLSRGITASPETGGPRSFGHFGMGGSVGWADPDTELATGYVMNKMDMGTTGDRRSFRLMRACVQAAAKA
jgi:CubicO group peptidase (beta-lactamase class C family)